MQLYAVYYIHGDYKRPVALYTDPRDAFAECNRRKRNNREGTYEVHQVHVNETSEGPQYSI